MSNNPKLKRRPALISLAPAGGNGYNRSKVRLFLLLRLLQTANKGYQGATAIAKYGTISGKYLTARLPMLLSWDYIKCKALVIRRHPGQNRAVIGYCLSAKGLEYLKKIKNFHPEKYEELEAGLLGELEAGGHHDLLESLSKTSSLEISEDDNGAGGYYEQDTEGDVGQDGDTELYRGLLGL